MEFYKQLIVDSPNPIYVKNQEGIIILANEAFAYLHGISLEVLLKKGTIDFDFAQKRDSDLIESGDSVSYEEYYKLPNGKKVWYNTIKNPIAMPDGETWLVSTSSEITELKKANLLADQAAKAKQTFLANVSHEMRTPMNGILGMVRLMNKTNLSPEQEKYLGFIQSNADNLLMVLNEIVDYANAEIGNIIQEKKPFDVIAQVQEIVAGFLVEAQEKGLKLSFVRPSMEFPIIEGDSYLLSQILTHLLNNALKFTQKGSICISLDKQEQDDKKVYITFVVEDTGIGIHTDKFELIFESFNQAYNNTSRLYGGTGLGLSLCKILVELQRGKIWLESVPSEGSKFCFTLPYEISAQKTVSSPKFSFETQNITGLPILLAEDNKVNQFLAISYLELIDAKVDVAQDGLEALAKSNEKKYDIILMDIQMPYMSGLEVTKKIRQEQSINKSTPIIAFTANVLRKNLEDYKKAGLDDFLAKPYTETELFRLIALHTHSAGLKELVRGTPSTEIKEVTSLEEPLYDFTNLGILGTDEDFLIEIKKLFIETIPPQIDVLAQAVQANEWAAIPGLTHNLKSTLGNIGINEAVKAIKKIEELALEGNKVKELKDLIEKVRSIIDRVITAFSNDLKN